MSTLYILLNQLIEIFHYLFQIYISKTISMERFWDEEHKM